MLDKSANHQNYVFYMFIYFMMSARVELQIYKIFRYQTISPHRKTLWPVKRLRVFNVEMIREIVFVRQNEKNCCHICTDVSEV